MEHGSFEAIIDSTGLLQVARTLMFEEGVLHAVNQNPDNNVLALVITTDRSQTFHRILQGKDLHSFHVELLQPD